MRTKLGFAICFGGLLLSSPLHAAESALALQGWNWKRVTSNLESIQTAGYAAIVLSPHTASCSGAFGGQGYDPSDFRSFDGGFGSETELKALIQKAHDLGIQVYANMVMNHMCTHKDYKYERFGWKDFHHNGRIENWNDPWQVENADLEGLNDLAHESSYVRGELWNYLSKTSSVGFDGFRYDGVKHVPKWYWRDHVNNNVRGWGKFGYGEVYDANLDLLQSYVDTGMSVTDYNLYFKMKDAFTIDGDLSSLDGAGFAARNGYAAVTFVQNHDVPAPTNKHLAHAFLAGYMGYPLFSDVDIKDPVINNLIWIHRKLAVGNYINRWRERDVLIFERQGNLIVGINQSNSWQSRWIDTSWSSKKIHDYAGHVTDNHTEADRRVEIHIPPMSYVMMAP